MRRPFFIGSLAIFAVAALGASPALAAMRGYIVTSFDTIRVDAPVRVVLRTGSGVSGSGEGDRAALDRVDLSVSGGVLTVRMDDRQESGDGKTAFMAPTLYLSTDQVRRVAVRGGAVITIEEVDGLEAELSLSGNGEIAVGRVDVERLTLYVGGGGRMTVGGSARELRVSVNGPGTLEATGLVAHDAIIANDGVGSIRVTVNGPAKVVSTGSGDTIVGGKPICTVTRRGVGQVLCGN